MIEKTKFGNGIVTLRLVDELEFLTTEIKNLTSVHCFPILQDTVLFTVNPRGIDLIGGHVENEETALETMMREAKEEASIVPIKYHLIGGIEIDNRENPLAIKKGYPEIGYQAFFAVDQFELLPFEATHECTDRAFVKFSEVKELHHNWLNIHQKLLEKAIAIYNTH